IVLDSLGNPGAAVGDIDDELLLVMPPGDIDSFSTRRIVQSIDNDVVENLGQSAAIDLGDKLRVAVRNCDADTKPSSFPHIQLMLILDHFLDFGRLIDEAASARIQLTEIEDVVDQTRQSTAGVE